MYGASDYPKVRGEVEFAVLGLARNCDAGAHSLLAELHSWSTAGIGVVAFVGENGSSDATRETLMRGGRAVRVVDTSAIASESDRFRRMAAGRQLVMNAFIDSGIGARYVVVVDLDGPFLQSAGLGAVRTAASMLDDPKLIGVSATSKPYYYDLLALDGPNLHYGARLAELLRLKGSVVTRYGAYERDVYREQKRLTRMVPMNCVSAFNGICIYRATDYRRVSYVSVDFVNQCEHITLNRLLHELTGGHVRVSDRLIVQCPREHGPQGFWAFLIRAISHRLLNHVRAG